MSRPAGTFPLLLLAFSARAAAQAPPPHRGADVSYYHFAIDLPDSGSEIHGKVAIGFVRTRWGDDTLRLNLVDMHPDRAWSIETAPPQPIAYDGKVLRVALRHWPPGDSGWAGGWVEWHGAPHDGLIAETNARGRRSFFGDNWPNRARDWIPTVDDPADKAEVLWSVTAPASWRVVANGRAMSAHALEGGRWQWQYRERRPIPTYTMVVGATEMTVSRHRPVVSGRDTIPIEVWAYPEDSVFADSVPFRRATEIVETLQRLIGPFPYEKLAHVESSTRYGGMENSSAIFYAEQGYVRRRMGEGVVRHETAHQWFGDAVTARDFHDLWLSEGFASYFDLVAGAALDGDSVLRRGMRADAQSYMRSRDVSRPVVDTTVTVLTQLLNANSYQKGAWVLHMLRGYLGDSAFFAGIRAYYHTWRDSSVTSGDLQRAMEQASGQSLDWFFSQWLRQPGYPQLDVAWSWDAATHEAVLDVAEAQPAAWGLFRLPAVQLEFLDGSRTIARRDVEVSAARQTIRVALPAAPSAVQVDPDGRLLLTSVVRRGPAAP
jgi:aminopeptidase N